MATIQGVYVALFGRPADPSGLAYFNTVTQGGANLNAIGDLSSTQEYQARFAGLNNVQIVNSIYQSLFNRDAEASGLNFFVNALNNGTLNINNIAIAILDGAQGSDLTIATNKITSANFFTAALDTPTEIGSYVGTAAAAQGRAFLAGVTTTAATQAQADTAVAAVVASGNVGNSIALTAGNDDLSLTTSVGGVFATDRNDTIDATTVLNSFNSGDKINGGFGTDTLNAQIDQNVTVATGGLTSVEVLNLEVVTNAATVDVANAVGLTQVWNNGSDKALTVDGVGLTTAVGLKDAIVGLTTFNFANATGASDSATLVVQGATGAAGVTIGSVETLNLNNTGTSAIGTVTAAAATSVNISGSGSLTFALADGAATTVTSTSSGTVTADLSAATKLVAFNGGAGIDDATVDTAGLTANLTLSGNGGADSLRVTGGATSSANTITLTGGDGSDLFYLGNGTALQNVNSVASAADLVKSLVTVSDFNKAADSLVFKGTSVALNVGQAGNVSGQTDLLSAATAAVSFAGANKATVFTYGSDAYIVADSDNSGAFSAGDALVKVTGVSAADLNATNLTFN